MSDPFVGKHADLLEHLPVAVALKDLAGRYTFVNRAFEEVTGLRRAGVLGRTPAALAGDGPFPPGFSPEENARVTAEQDAAVLALGRAATYDEVAPGPDGDRHFWVTRFPLRGPDGAPIGVASISQEVTASVRLAVAHEARRAELAQLQEVQRMKDLLLATLSHEIRTPLAVIQGYAELLEERFGGDPHLTGLQSGVSRLHEQFQRILDLTALVGGSMRLYRAPVDAAEVLEAVVREAGPQATSHVRIAVAVAPDLPPIDGDVRRLVQLVGELLANAVRHAPEGSRVELGAWRAGPGEVVLTVCDDGPGIAPEVLARAWQPFAEGDLDTARCSDGMGLGLPTASLLARQHGGRIEATCGRPAACDGGTCFRVLLPAAVELGLKG